MSQPSRQPTRAPDEALEILRRLEPVLTKLDDRVRKIEIDVARTDGRLTGIESQLRQVPTIWQVVGAITAINGLAIAMALGVIKLVHSL